VISGCGGGTGNSEVSGTPPSLASTPAVKAAMELGSAQTLERSRKTKKAIEAYRRIMEVYPESPQAEIAREKVKSLEKK
jgi:TolA-binding protein